MAQATPIGAASNDERLRKIYQNAPIGIAITDSQGKFLECNSEYCSLLGYTEGELRRLNGASLIHPEDREANLAQVQRLLARKISSCEIENRYIRKNGEPVWVRKFVSVLPGSNGRPDRVIALVSNTTAHHSAIAALRASEERYRGLAEQVSDGIFVTDSQGRYLDSNRTGCEMLGYTLEELKSLALADVVAPEDLPRLEGQFLDLAKLETVRNTWRLRRKDGSIFSGGLVARQLSDGRIQGVLRDVTQFERFLTVLRDQALLDLAHDSILIIDADDRITYWNGGAARCYGWSKNEAVGQVAYELLKTEYPESRESILETLRRRGRWEGELVHTCRDGRQIMVDSRWVVQHDPQGKGFRILEINTDITERKKAELSVRASEQQLKSYMDNCADAILVLESESGRIVNANERALQMLGYARDELLKLSATDVECARSPAQIRAGHERSKQTVVRVEGVHRRKDGSTYPAEIRLTSLAPTQPHLVLALAHDITERKRAEEMVREEARRKDEFLAVLGHELRNPLAAVYTALQVLSANDAPAQRAELQEVMSRQVELMRRLLDDLLDLSRISHGHIELRKGPIGLAEFMQNVAAAAYPNFTSRRQKFVLCLPNEPVRFMADKVRLEQIAMNLLSNASKYTAQEGVIEFSGGREGSEVVLRCKDNGRGILPETQQKIFDPFTRVLTDSYGEASLGIGLTLVKRLLELHGGTISVKSDGAGMGSEFTVRLPLVAPSNQVMARKPKGAPGSRCRRSILMVEDNPVVARVMKVALEQAGHEVHTFGDGPSALASVSALKLDAVLLDIALPGMDGYELAGELKKHRNIGEAMFIAISGFQTQSRVENPFDHYLTKPVQMPALLALLDEASGVKKTASTSAGEPGGLRALLVEDHQDVAASMAKLLQREGLEVRTARTGGEALKAAQKMRPQAILCDMNLPDMKGLELIGTLRSDPKTRRTYVAMISAKSEAEMHVYNSHAQKLGVDVFIAKPITATVIRALIAKVKSSLTTRSKGHRNPT
jgi:PAS domain S-box-containing protein